MLYPILPGALHQDYEARVAEWRDKRRPPPQEFAVGLDFADFDRERYSAVTQRKSEQLTARPQRLLERIRNWGIRRWTRRTA